MKANPSRVVRIFLPCRDVCGQRDFREDETPWPVRIAVIEDHSGKLTAIDFEAGGAKGVLRAAPNMSGRVRVTAEVAGRQIFEAYLDRPYKEHPIMAPPLRV